MRPILLRPIHIKLQPSYLILGLLSGVSIASCLIIINLPISPYIQFAIVALIIISTLYFILRDALLLLPWSWQVVEVDNKGELTISNHSGHKFHPILASSSFIHAACSILNFKRNGFRLALPPIILLATGENADELRRLRIWLRWFRHNESPQDDSSVADDLAR